MPTLLNPKEAEMRYCGIDLHSNNSVVVVATFDAVPAKRSEADWVTVVIR